MYRGVICSDILPIPKVDQKRTWRNAEKEIFRVFQNCYWLIMNLLLRSVAKVKKKTWFICRFAGEGGNEGGGGEGNGGSGSGGQFLSHIPHTEKTTWWSEWVKNRAMVPQRGLKNHTHACTHTHIKIYTHIYVHTYTHIYIHMYTHAHTYIYTYMHPHTYIYTLSHTHA